MEILKIRSNETGEWTEIAALVGPEGPAGKDGYTPQKGVDYFDGQDGKDGPQGPIGPAGEGVPAGGSAGQVLAKKSADDYDTEWVNQSGGSGGGLETIVAGTGHKAELFNYSPDENDEQEYGFGTIDSQFRGTHQATGDYSHAEGWLTKATGFAAHAEGCGDIIKWNNDNWSYRCPVASGKGSHAGGIKDAIASGEASFAHGVAARAMGSCSIALGNQVQAIGANSFATGSTARAMHSSSAAFGYITNTTNGEQMVIGKFNSTSNPTDVKYSFIIGNGTSNTSDKMSNSFTVDTSGNIACLGTVSSAGADYAEFFEWLDGNSENEDRVGYIVALDGDKIRLANAADDVLGIISATATILGDNPEWCWNKKWLTDDFGRTIYKNQIIHHDAIYNPDGEIVKDAYDEEGYAPVVNPDYDPDQPYINRRNRPEWAAVGMMGKLFVRDDGSCLPNFYATVGENGVATLTATKTNMRVMKRVADNIVQVCLK